MCVYLHLDVSYRLPSLSCQHNLSPKKIVVEISFPKQYLPARIVVCVYSYTMMSTDL